MKNIFLAAAVVVGLGLGASTVASAADGTITFNGEVTSVTCSIHGGTPGGAADFAVTLPTVQTSAFNAGVGTAAGAVPYNITLGAAGEASCTNGQIVSIHYEPTSPRVDAATGNLMVDPVTGAATGVELQVLNTDKSVINLANASDSATQVVAGNTATLPFYAQYISKAATVTAGPANSSVLYSVKYN